MNLDNNTSNLPKHDNPSKLHGASPQDAQSTGSKLLKKVSSDIYQVKTYDLIDLQTEVYKLAKNTHTAMNDNHFVIAIGDMTLLVGRISCSSPKIVNLLSITGKTNEGIEITHLSISNCFEQNYLIVMTSNLQLIIFFIKSTDGEDQIMRFPMRICNKSEPLASQWRDNVFFYSFDSEIHTLTFQELPNIEVWSISNEVLAECCDYKKTLDTQSKIEHFDVSKVNNLFYIQSKERIFVYDEESRIQYIYKPGHKDERTVCIRSLGAKLGNEADPKDNQKRAVDYIVAISDKHKIYVHDAAFLKGNNPEESARVAVLDLKQYHFGEGVNDRFDDMLVTPDGSYIVVISRSMKLALCLVVNRHYIDISSKDGKTNKKDFPFFDSIVPITLPEAYLTSIVLTKNILEKHMIPAEVKNSVQNLLTIYVQNAKHLAVNAVPLDLIHIADEVVEKVEIQEVDVTSKDIKIANEPSQVLPLQRIDDLQNQFNQMTKDINDLPQNTNLEHNKPTGFLDLAEVERQMMEKALESRQESSQTLNEKPADKQNEDKTEKVPEDLTKQKTKKPKQEADQFVKNLSELFIGFHEQLAKKVTKIVDENKKSASKELLNALTAASKELKKSFNDEASRSNEKVLIPNFEKSVFKIFEKYTISLDKTYNTYTDKMDSELFNSKNLGGSLDAIFASHLDTANKIQQTLDLFMSNIEKIANNAEKADSDPFMSLLQSIANNQASMHNNLTCLNLRVENMESVLQYIMGQHSEMNRLQKEATDVRTPYLANAVNPTFNFAREAQQGWYDPMLSETIKGNSRPQLSYDIYSQPMPDLNMNVAPGEMIYQAEIGETPDKKDTEVRKKIFTPVFMNPFGMSMIYGDNTKPKDITD